MAAILVVDDEPAVLSFSRFVLAKNGFTVLTASSAPDALRAFAAAGGDIDLLVADVIMPGVDGPTLAARLLELKPDLPVLFVSGFSYEPPAAAQARCGFLSKPFAPQALLKEVNALLPGPAGHSPASLSWQELRQKSEELARRCARLALEYEGLNEHVEETIRRSRKLLGQE